MAEGKAGKSDPLPVLGPAPKCIAALATLVGILYYAYTYSYPSGKPLELWELALMFPREFVIVSFAAVVILLIVASWCIKLYKRVSSSNS